LLWAAFFPRISARQDFDRDTLVAMRRWLTFNTTTFAADHRPAHMMHCAVPLQRYALLETSTDDTFFLSFIQEVRLFFVA